MSGLPILPCIQTCEGRLYPAALLDLATRKIVGWAMRDHMRAELPLAALMMAAQRQPIRGRGVCQTPHHNKGDAIDELHGVLYDNAPIESVFHTLNVELAHQR